MQPIEYYSAGELIPACLHRAYSIAFLEQRMSTYIDTLCRHRCFRANDIGLYVDVGPFPSPAYGIIYLTSGRILELHILDNPHAIDTAMQRLCLRDSMQFIEGTSSRQ